MTSHVFTFRPPLSLDTRDLNASPPPRAPRLSPRQPLFDPRTVGHVAQLTTYTLTVVYFHGSFSVWFKFLITHEDSLTDSAIASLSTGQKRIHRGSGCVCVSCKRTLCVGVCAWGEWMM